jgi:hypothetical protein
MRKLIFAFIVLLSISSCKKDNKEEKSIINTSDPNAVTAAVKVWHGSLVTGQPPAPSNNNNVQLDASLNDEVVAIAGRYAIISPEVVAGDIAGYYLQINGAGSYFKVDFSKPRTTNRVRTSRPHSKPGLRLSTDSTNNADSAIVITIPDNIEPGEFCVTYCAYDAQGNVSNLVTTCVTITSFGGDATVSYLEGNWKLTGSKEDGLPWEDAAIGDTTYSDGYCVNGRPSYFCDSSICSDLRFINYIGVYANDVMNFGKTGALQYKSEGTDKYLLMDSSTCNNFKYESENYSYQMSGAWSYDNTAKKITLVFDFDEFGLPEPEFYEFELTKVSDKIIYLKDPIEEYTLRFEKL